LLIGAGTSPQSIAAMVSHAVYDGQRVKLRAIGASAVNQAVKGIAIARGWVAARGIDLLVRPGFDEVIGNDGDELSAIVLVVVID
jgi:stage V sporulation protein S